MKLEWFECINGHFEVDTDLCSFEAIPQPDGSLRVYKYGADTESEWYTADDLEEATEWAKEVYEEEQALVEYRDYDWRADCDCYMGQRIFTI